MAASGARGRRRHYGTAGYPHAPAKPIDIARRKPPGGCEAGERDARHVCVMKTHATVTQVATAE